MKTILAWIRERCRFAQSECYTKLDPNSADFERAFDKAYECAANMASSLAPSLRNTLLGTTSPFRCSVDVDVKNKPRTKEKFIEKEREIPGKYDNIMGMPDLLRATVYLPIKYEPQRITQEIVGRLGAEKVERVQKPDTGYDAIHIDTTYGGMKTEIQVMYKHMRSWKSEAHKEYKPQQPGKPLQQQQQQQQQQQPDLRRMREMLIRPHKRLEKMRRDRLRRHKERRREPHVREREVAFNLRVMRKLGASEKGMMDYAKMVEEAREFARQKHRGQKRKHHDEDYFVHPERVALVAQELGLPPEDVAAAYVHDVIEDVPSLMGVPGHLRAETAEKLRLEIEQKFGPQVASMALDLTNPSKGLPLPRAERKRMDREHASMTPERVRILKAIDRIDNLRDFARAGDKVTPQFRKMYAEESRLLADALVQEGASERLLRLVETMRQEAARLEEDARKKGKNACARRKTGVGCV